MHEVIVDPDRIAPGWLTEALRAHGHLPRGRVASVRVVSRSETPPSVHARLAVEYSPDAPVLAPARLFFKAPKPHKLVAGKRERDFYATVAPAMPRVPLARAYAHGHDPATGASYLLLEDLADSHRPATSPWPSWPELAAMADALARLHAAWWAHPRLREAAGPRPEESFWESFAGNERRFAELADLLGDRLTHDQRRVFERFLAAGPALLLGRAAGQGIGGPLTLLHAENHRGNFLLPRQPGGDVYLIDWHQYRAWWGPKDLAVLVARCVPPEQRDRALGLLRHYHERLLSHGVPAYPWEACLHDYRLAAIDNLTFLLQIRHDAGWVVGQLEASMRELAALDCLDLLA